MKALKYHGRLVVLTDKEVEAMEMLRSVSIGYPKCSLNHLIGLGFVTELYSFGDGANNQIPTSASLTAEGENFLRCRDINGHWDKVAAD